MVDDHASDWHPEKEDKRRYALPMTGKLLYFREGTRRPSGENPSPSPRLELASEAPSAERNSSRTFQRTSAPLLSKFPHPLARSTIFCSYECVYGRSIAAFHYFSIRWFASLVQEEVTRYILYYIRGHRNSALVRFVYNREGINRPNAPRKVARDQIQIPGLRCHISYVVPLLH